jgi:hypothetical protein
MAPGELENRESSLPAGATKCLSQAVATCRTALRRVDEALKPLGSPFDCLENERDSASDEESASPGHFESDEEADGGLWQIAPIPRRRGTRYGDWWL